jgi:hypothetical protein
MRVGILVNLASIFFWLCEFHWFLRDRCGNFGQFGKYFFFGYVNFIGLSEIKKV